jgi:hypothetical protein
MMVNIYAVTAMKNAPLRMVCALSMSITAKLLGGCFLIYAQITLCCF